MKIAHLIFLSFLLILILFSSTTIINYRLYNRVKENTDFLARSSTIVRESNRLQRNLLNMLSAGRGYSLTGERSFLESFDSTAAENRAIQNELIAAVGNPEQRRDLLAIGEHHNKWVQNYTSILTGTNKGNAPNSFRDSLRLPVQGSASLHDEGASFGALQLSLRKFINEEYARREVQKGVLARSIRTTRAVSFSLTALSLILGVVIAVGLARTLSRRILKMVSLAKSISKGDYTVKVNDARNDELSMLSFSLNEMAGVLAENFTLLKRKNEELDQYAHVVSHDLKAPLRGIGNVVCWIEEDHSGDLPPRVHDYLQLIQGRLNRAENLINGILAYARSGTEEQESEEIDVHAMVQQIVGEESYPSTISLEIGSGLPVLWTQRVQLSQIFSNLINNAFKHHDKRDGKITIYGRDLGEYHEFYVADNGPGIALNHQEKIIRIFQTLQERDSFESTGVGLAIIKKILDARKEQIKLHSEVGVGSTFCFTWKK